MTTSNEHNNAPAVPQGWAIKFEGNDISVSNDHMGCIVPHTETVDRKMPSEVLHALCRDLLAATKSTVPAQYPSEMTLRDYAEALIEAGHDFWKACRRDAGGGAVRWPAQEPAPTWSLREALQKAKDALSLALSDVDWRKDSPTQPVIHKAYNCAHQALALPTAEQVDDINVAESFTSVTKTAAPAQEVASAFTTALDIRLAQGWNLTGNAIPVLYTDTINDYQVRRDDVWLCTTDALKTKQEVVLTDEERADMACAVAAICTGTSSRTVAATAIEWTERALRAKGQP